jgi:hypothetical protein
MKKWESKDSNFSAYDLQSLLAAPASFPIAEGVGIEPCPEGPRQFSRLFAPMRGTIQKAENCGPDPQTFYRSRDLAGRPYPSRLILQRDSNQNRTDIDIVLQTKPKTNIGYAVIVRMDGIEPPTTRFSVWHSTAELHPHCAPDRIRTCKISGLSGTRLPVTSQAQKYPRKDSNLQTPDPKSGAFTNLTTQAENKKASDFSEAVCIKIDPSNYSTIQPRPLKRYKYELYSEQLSILQI